MVGEAETASRRGRSKAAGQEMELQRDRDGEAETETERDRKRKERVNWRPMSLAQGLYLKRICESWCLCGQWKLSAAEWKVKNKGRSA